MWGEGSCNVFRMELSSDKKRMIGKLDGLDKLAVRRKTTKNQAGFFQLISVIIIKLVAMAMSFVNSGFSFKI